MAEESSGGGEHTLLVQLILEAINKMTEPIERAEKDLRKLVTGMREVGSAAIELFAVREALEGVLEPAEKMQTQLAYLRNATGASNEQLQQVKETAEKLGATLGVSSEDTVAAVSKMAITFGSVTKAMQASSVAAKLAVDAHTTVAKASELLAATYEQAGDKAKPFNTGIMETANNLAYLLTKTAMGSSGLERMEQDIANLTSAADQLHIPLQTLEAIDVTLSNLHIGGERGAGFAMREMLDTLTRTKEVGKQMMALGLNKFWAAGPGGTKTLDFFKNMIWALHHNKTAYDAFIAHFGQSGRIIDQTIRHWDMVNAETAKMTKEHNLLNQQVQVLEQTLGLTYARFGQVVDMIADRIGTVMIPKVTAIVDWLAKTGEAVDDFAGRHPGLVQFAADVGGIVAAVIGLSAAVSLGLAALNMMTDSIETTLNLAKLFAPPWLLILVAVAAIVLAIYEHWDTIKKIFREGVAVAGYWIREFWRLLTGQTETTKATMDAAHKDLRNNLEGIGDAVKALWDWAKKHPFDALMVGFAAVAGSVKIVKTLAGAYDTLKTAINAVKDAQWALDAAQAAYDILAAPEILFFLALAGGVAVVVGLVYELTHGLRDVKAFMEWLRDKGLAIWREFAKIVGPIAAAISAAIGATPGAEAAARAGHPLTPSTIPAPGGGAYYWRPDYPTGHAFLAAPPPPPASANIHKESLITGQGGPAVSMPVTLNMTVHGADAGTAQSIKAQVMEALDSAQDKLRALLDEFNEDTARTSLDDRSYAST